MTKRSMRMSESEAERLINRMRLQQTADSAARLHGLSGQSTIGIKTPVGAANGVKRWQSLGRLPAGKLNKTEQAYSNYLEERRRCGSILWFKAHAFNVRLADNTFYRVDFLVLASDMALEIHEVKGGFTSEKGQMKIKLCAEVLPVFRMFKVSKLSEKMGSGWKIEDFST